jgi:hypothetical protein
VGDPVASHERGRVLQQQRLAQAAVDEERAAGAEDRRDLVDETWSISPSVSAWPPI